MEDNPANIKLIESLAKKIDGLNLTTKKTAEKGIIAAVHQQPDLIILDINLPGINGFEALATLKDIEETANIPVIALSASATAEDIKNGLESGFSHYLTKPIQLTEVVAVLQSKLNGQKNSNRD